MYIVDSEHVLFDYLYENVLVSLYRSATPTQHPIYLCYYIYKYYNHICIYPRNLCLNVIMYFTRNTSIPAQHFSTLKDFKRFYGRTFFN